MCNNYVCALNLLVILGIGENLLYTAGRGLHLLQILEDINARIGSGSPDLGDH